MFTNNDLCYCFASLLHSRIVLGPNLDMPSSPLFSVVVVFHNMQREAPRTLYSLSSAYQIGSESIAYEVIAIDNGSSAPLDKKMVESFGPQFAYHYLPTKSKSPVDAINFGAGIAEGKYLCINIDGARILSPGIFDSIRKLVQIYESPFIYTLGLHLGPDLQNRSMLAGYDQGAEDQLLDDIDWQEDGYQLFEVSSLAGSSKDGYLGTIVESNCYCMPRDAFQRLGGLNKGFQSPGGGLVNLDIFQQACNTDGMMPVLLLGEGTFHQFHGGVATNVAPEVHPMEAFKEEYTSIYGKPLQEDHSIEPILFGKIHPASRKLFCV